MVKKKRLLSREPSASLNNICPYFTMFPLEFPYEILKGAKQSEKVLDPFCGRGTTLFAARMCGLGSYGIDSNPVAAAVSAAKIAHASVADILRELVQILESRMSFDIPDGRFWDLAFHKQTLEQVCKVRQSLLDDCSSSSRVCLRAIMLGALHGPLPKSIENAGYFSNQMPRTYASKPDYSVSYWEGNGFHPSPEISVFHVVERRTNRYFSAAPPRIANGFVRKGDARQLSSYEGISDIAWIVTSPPYFGLDTYIPDQWLRNWFLGGPSRPEYGRNRQIDHGSAERFASSLGQVWKLCEDVSQPGARMHVRFGGIPSQKTEPLEILKHSFSLSKASWKMVRAPSSGSAERGYRQALQMKTSTKAREEFDVELILE